MNQYVTGAVIKDLRDKNHLTQAMLAEKLSVSDKTVSKWETGKGYPDITLLEPIAKVFGVSIMELLAGKAIRNENMSANMLRSQFYICPVCGNVLHSMGQAQITCHGVPLLPAEAEEPDDLHSIRVETIEDEYFVQIDHEMSKEHYISFLAAVSADRVHLVKLYPEGSAEARLPIRGTRKIYWFCNRDGLYCLDLRKGKRALY